MDMRKILIVSAVFVGVSTVAVAAWSTVWPNGPSYAAGVVARQVHFGGHGGGHGGHGRGMAMICSEQRDQRIEDGRAFIEGFVNFTPDQTAAWAELTEAVRAGSATVGEKCRELDGAHMPKTTPERLAHFEVVATTGLSILKQVRPAFDRFYATLTDQQKSALDNLLSRHGQRS